MIWKLVFLGCAAWFTWWDVRLLYVAATKRYVMALPRPFVDTVEKPQTRDANPQKFWATVVVALLLLPVALGGLYLASTDLYVVLTARPDVF